MKPAPTNLWTRLRTAMVACLSVAILAAGVYAFRSVARSRLFVIQVVEIAEPPAEAPLDAQAISRLAAVPLGSESLFEIDLRPIEARLLSHPWIREVRLEKRFPHTLGVAVKFREPKALLQARSGSLSYIDARGEVFGEVNLLTHTDLPILTGIEPDQKARISESLRLIEAWSRASLSTLSQIASVSYESERGYRALVVYPPSQPRARAYVDLGHEIDAEFPVQLKRLAHVFKYLAESDLAARQIWADTGKKIVVKIARGS